MLPDMAKDLPSQAEIDQVLSEHLPDYVPGEPLAVVEDLREVHGAYHRIAYKAAIRMKVLKEHLQLTWLQIHQLTGVDPSTSRRWVDKLADQPEPAEDWKP